LQGVIIAAGVLGLYYHFMEIGVGLSYVRTMVFITLIVSNVFLTFVNRSFEETVFKTIRYKNSLTKYVLLASFVFLGCISFIPFVRGLFELTLLKTGDYALCLGVAMIVTLWFEVYKALRRNRTTAHRV
jgi:Ca2+-transporting ATPase